jgi:hypothetical protein
LRLFFSCTLFLGSALLFLVQPMIAKMLLPRLGGSPAVWNTCMVFFQAALLAGYAYAHALTARLPARGQTVVHLGVLVLPFALLLLPLGIPAAAIPPQSPNPAFWLLGVLVVSVGLPFFALAANAPLLQAWYGRSGHPTAQDPYFLYAASNLGSMLALLSYPMLFEPWLTLREQTWWWTAGYALLAALIAVMAVVLGRVPRGAIPRSKKALAAEQIRDEPVTASRRWRWVGLAFIPSSLMLSVTTYLTTDIAAVPLLWVIPLALYLLSFIVVFASRPLVAGRLSMQALPRTSVLLVLVWLTEANEPKVLVTAIHLVGLLVLCLACHGELAADRPVAKHLTEFYLWLSVGGVLGGLFNALVAPVLFPSILEYPLVLLLVSFVPVWSRDAESKPGHGRREWGLPLGLFALTLLLVIVFQTLGVPPGPASVALMFGAPIVWCYTFLERPVRFGLGVAGLLLASSCYHGTYGDTLFRTRDFFGVHRVTSTMVADSTERFHQLVNGYTVHGLQSENPDRDREPLTYYTRSGPIGQVFAAFSGTNAKKNIAVIGLGAGSLSAYAEPGQEWTYLEIDPEVRRIALDPSLFTFLSASAVHPRIVLGDARLSLEKRTGPRFDLMVFDAFSSDAIPAHLLTREALRIYLKHLTEGGVIAFHISNKYLDLAPVLGDLADDAGLACRSQNDLSLTDEERRQGKFPSRWVILARKDEHFATLAEDSRWPALSSRKNPDVWTDDYYNLLRVFRWSESAASGVSP